MRDFNKETHDVESRKYAYSFDFDVMHKYMMRAFEPYFVDGKVLELGCFEGAFTERLADRFGQVTCVEASSDAARVTRGKLHDRVTVLESPFEEVQIDGRFENIVMTHVLEHVEDALRVLKRVNDEWLAEGGRFFLVCPNANAPSRQIAVKMGLISHNSAVTEGESSHGHHRTYSLDTLERDARAAGLAVEVRQGIFFKALANFQFDQLIGTDVISDEYLEGCYQLGQHYPDLCASIFLLCSSGGQK